MALLDLPDELQLLILEAIDNEHGWDGVLETGPIFRKCDLASFVSTCRRFCRIAQPLLWHPTKYVGENPCYWAAERGRIDILERALQYGHALTLGPAFPWTRIDITTSFGWTALSPIEAACKADEAGAVEWFLDHGIPTRTPVAPGRQRPWFHQPLQMRALGDSRTNVSLLLLRREPQLFFYDGPEGLEGFVTHNDRTEYRLLSTALHMAVEARMLAVIDHILQEHLVDVGIRDSTGLTALERAVGLGNNGAVIKRLAAGGANLNRVTTRGGKPTTLLIQSITSGSLENALALLNAGANPNWSQQDGVSPLLAWFGRKLCKVCFEGQRWESLLAKLIDKGADVNPDLKRHNSPLRAAIEFGHPATVSMLLKAGANLNRPEIDGSLPSSAIWKLHNNETISKIGPALLQNGAYLETPDPLWGKSLLQQAIERASGRMVSRPDCARHYHEMRCDRCKFRHHLGFSNDRWHNNIDPVRMFLSVATANNMRPSYPSELVDEYVRQRRVSELEVLERCGVQMTSYADGLFQWAKDIIEAQGQDRRNAVAATNRLDFRALIRFLPKPMVNDLLHLAGERKLDQIEGGLGKEEAQSAILDDSGQ